jgi:hypothetical protein
VIDLLAAGADPGLVGMSSGRFFGFVIGGTHPAALAADWLVSAWDQNWGMRLVTPAHTAVEDTAGAWLLDLLGLPAGSSVGFATASSRLRHFVTGIEGADSWATDAHKTLNVPYDCGVVIVRDPAAMRAAMGMHGDYLLADEQYGDPHERVPSCRAVGGPSRSGRCCARSAGPAWPSWSAAWSSMRALRPTAFGPSTGPRCSTWWSSPRSVPHSAPTSAPAPS